MIRKYILGNWKMHGLRPQAVELAAAIASQPVPNGVEVALFPPFTALALVAEHLRDARVALGAQDCSPEMQGPFTGEVSARMLAEAGCRYVLAGHSERRSLHGETDALVRRKAEAAIAAGLVPVICVGENLQEREAGKHLEIVRAQVEASLPSHDHSGGYLVAYEPVWAIGSGKTPTLAQISEVHKTIASLLSYATSGARPANALGVVYGGSVKASNAREILCAEGVDGVLVGGASLKAEEFYAIVQAH